MSGKKPKRPFLSRSVVQLEELFRDHAEDKKQLQELAQELKHRRTRRAQRLAGLVERVIEGWQPERAIAPKSAPSPEESPKLDPPIVSEPPYFGGLDSETSSVESPLSPPIRPAAVQEACRVLDAWLALEVLSPQIYRRPSDLASGDRRLVAEISGQQIPWLGQGEKARPKTRLFYQVILGVIDMEKASRALLEVYTDKRIDRPQSRGFAALGVVVVDREGLLLDDDGVALSSFAWGLPLALRKELRALPGWASYERGCKQQLEKILRPRDEDGEPIPLQYSHLVKAFTVLVDEFGLDPAMILEPSVAIRSFQWIAIKTPPEPILLNSFFVGDLIRAKRAVARGEAGAALKRYLQLETPKRRTDLLESTEALEALCAPQRIPPGRWPSTHSLAVLQQAAVNGAAEELLWEGILGVNGPPGTGKTTLLRDIVASVVVRRAEAMATFEDPESAFTHAGKMRIGTGFCHFYSLDGEVKGHEILVASSNNKAVENISRELPELDALDPASSLRYLSTVSDATLSGEHSTWGLIAAVLGNAANRRAFSDVVWSQDDTSLKSYLLAAAGKKPKPVEEADPVTGEIVERPPAIVTAEDPPNGRKESLERWAVAREAFLTRFADAQEILETLERGRRHAFSLERLEASLHQIEQSLSHAEQRHRQASEDLEASQDIYNQLRAQEDAEICEHRAHHHQKPWLFHRLFQTKRWQKWALEDRRLKERLVERSSASAQSEMQLVQEREAVSELERQLEATKTEKEGLSKQIAASQDAIQSVRRFVGSHFADRSFWSRSHGRLHIDSAWTSGAVEASRSRVFEAAMQLHKAFLDAAAKPMRHNLMALFSIFRGTGLGSSENAGLVGDIWSSLFLLTPVVSTTFASVERMIGKLPKEHIGWLLVDEAGQALPQSAIGALLRSRRAVMVGDPLQLQPIVSLAPDLVAALFREIGPDPDEWAPPLVSAQTLADQASCYASSYEQEAGSVLVGLPLLVHRRCQDPMFSISNQIAYGGNMVFASRPEPSQIVEILGDSRWIAVDSSGRTKWSEEEGQVVLSMIHKLHGKGIQSPDLFVISPFVVVAQQLRERLARSEAVRSWSHAAHRWVGERVGTVHTFQGKEAEAVVLVLGAPNPEQTGARAWAGYPPNLLNVAATRAKAALYVVGSRSLWQDQGCFRVLNRRIGPTQLVM